MADSTFAACGRRSHSGDVIAKTATATAASGNTPQRLLPLICWLMAEMAALLRWRACRAEARRVVPCRAVPAGSRAPHGPAAAVIGCRPETAGPDSHAGGPRGGPGPGPAPPAARQLGKAPPAARAPRRLRVRPAAAARAERGSTHPTAVESARRPDEPPPLRVWTAEVGGQEFERDLLAQFDDEAT